MIKKVIDTSAFPSEVKTAFALLGNAGYEVYAVGGCVRDILMGREPHDFDLTTNALPCEIVAVFSGYKTLTYGALHGTVTVFFQNGEQTRNIEITTFRVDGEYLDSRHPSEVTFTGNITDDLARRDFTINAICCTVDGDIIDPFNGAEDIEAGVIRTVGDPEKRFAEDALRVLRALRFASVTGFEIEAQTAEKAAVYASGLKKISPERVRDELVKLLCGRYVCRAMIEHHGIICEIIPELGRCVGFDQRKPNHIYDVYTHIAHTVGSCKCKRELRLAALFHDIAKPLTFAYDRNGNGSFYGHDNLGSHIANTIMSRLRFDTATREYVVFLVKKHDKYVKPILNSVKWRMVNLGVDGFFDLFELQHADGMSKAPDIGGEKMKYFDEVRSLAEQALADGLCLSVSDLAIDGNDVAKLGASGPLIGKVLKQTLQAVTFNYVENEKDALAKYVRMLVKRDGMKNKKYILFDLDGTLTDPAEGITNSVIHALEHYGITDKTNKELECFIGPPLFESFMKYFGFSKEQAIEAVEIYREYFRPYGMFENVVYDGVGTMLERLKNAGKVLLLATSKPKVFADKILEHFDLMKYFDCTAGSELDGTRIDKADVVAHALALAGVKDISTAVMVGDREHDIIGGKKNGLDTVGVTYGYGSRLELEEAGADCIYSSPMALVNLFT